ncbi:MAG: integration host factor subunit beta [Treponema sp.]|jgi:nucleoid DNA-binding protein|nr:integration host factor subunit beta [Treponema sp.]
MSKNKFTRTQIQEIIISGACLDVRKATEVTGQIIKSMTAALAAGEMIELRGFGSLEVKERKATTKRNPQTGEPVIVPPRRRVLFRPGQELKAALRINPEG